jgi:hypothetical protein
MEVRAREGRHIEVDAGRANKLSGSFGFILAVGDDRLKGVTNTDRQLREMVSLPSIFPPDAQNYRRRNNVKNEAN